MSAEGDLGWPFFDDGHRALVRELEQWTAAQFRAHFDQVIASVRDPAQYAVWFVPMVSGRRPAR